MNALEKLRTIRAKDRAMARWMMVLGILVTGASVYFILQNFTRGWLAQALLIGCALIGAITFAAGAWPRNQADEFQREALSEFMREQLDEENSNVPS